MSKSPRCFTESEWKAVRDALPRRLHPLMDEIEFVPETCWCCEMFKDGYCRQHMVEVPHEEKGKTQPCFVQAVLPF